jgi:hypothetical protein
VPIGAKARQPDFVVLSPRWGVLLLEVKDWKRATLGPATRDAVELLTPRGRVTQPHPLRQARDCTLELVDLMKRDPALVHADGPFRGRLLFPYGWGVVFSACAAPRWPAATSTTLFPPQRTLLRDDLDEALPAADFQRRLWGMFTVSYPHTLTLPQRDRIRWHLFPEVRCRAGPLDFDRRPAPADAVAATTAAARPAAGDGPAAGADRAHAGRGPPRHPRRGRFGQDDDPDLPRPVQLAAAARPDQPILVLCFNRTLADRIEAHAAPSAVSTNACRCAPSTAGARTWCAATSSICRPR